MAYIYPAPKTAVATAPVDTKPLQDAIAALQSNETVDDAALTALKTTVEAIKVPDVAPLQTEVETVKSTVTGQASDIATLKSQRTDLKASIDSLDNALGALDLRVGKIAIPDVSGFAKKTDIPTVPPAPDLSGYALKTDLSTLATKAEIPVVPPTPDLTPYALKTSLPDVSGLATKTALSAVEAKIPTVTATTDLLGVQALTAGKVVTTAELPAIAAATTSPNPADTTLSQNWKVFPLTNGEEWRNTANTGFFFRIEYTATGFDFTYAGITGSPWSVSDGTSRSFTGTLAAQTKSYASSASSITVAIPGSARTFIILKPIADVVTGWILTGQDTRLGFFSGIYQSATKGLVKVLWGKGTAVVQVWGLAGTWKVDQTTTAAQPQQTIAIASTEAKYLTLDNSNQIKVTTPNNEVITLNRPRSIVTWDGVLEKPDPYGTVWDAPDITFTDATQSYQWRNRTDNTEYLRVTFGAANTMIERVKAAAQRDDWFRLTKADGTIVTGKAGANIITGQYALAEVWYASGVNASVPTTAPDFYLPIPILLNDKNLVPQLWTELLAKKQLDTTAAGKAISAIDTAYKAADAALGARITALESARSIFSYFNAGTWIAFKTLQYTIPSSGNRSLQIRSASGSISVKWITWLNWDTAFDPANLSATITTTSAQYLLSTWNFTAAGNRHTAIIYDSTNNKRYRVDCAIGNAYNNNVLIVEDIT